MSDLEITIHDVAFGGSGVGRLPDGKIVFVPRALAGEKVRIRLDRSKKAFAEAELLEVIEPSPQRVSPPCPYFGRCGGCQYQHATYEEQLRIKEKQVRDTLQRIGGFKELPPLHFKPAPRSHAYRNKITVHSGPLGEIGFFAHDTRTVVDVERCWIASEAINEQLAVLRKKPFPFGHRTLTEQAQRGDSPEGSFHQVNTEMARKLLDWVRDRLPYSKEGRLLDVYCGAGFFALALADRFEQVCGVDRDERAIHAATARAHESGLANVQFFAASVEQRLEWLIQDIPLPSTTILVDPPREGLTANVLDLLSRKPCARLAYISCNPATLARDLKKLTQAGAGPYRLSTLGAFDMFPQTAHMEVAAILEAV